MNIPQVECSHFTNKYIIGGIFTILGWIGLIILPVLGIIYLIRGLKTNDKFDKKIKLKTALLAFIFGFILFIFVIVISIIISYIGPAYVC